MNALAPLLEKERQQNREISDTRNRGQEAAEQYRAIILRIADDASLPDDQAMLALAIEHLGISPSAARADADAVKFVGNGTEASDLAASEATKALNEAIQRRDAAKVALARCETEVAKAIYADSSTKEAARRVKRTVAETQAAHPRIWPPEDARRL